MDLTSDRKSHNSGISTTLSNPPAVLQKANVATETESHAENIEAQQNKMECFVVYCAQNSVPRSKTAHQGVRHKEVYAKVRTEAFHGAINDMLKADGPKSEEAQLAELLAETQLSPALSPLKPTLTQSLSASVGSEPLPDSIHY